jgi:hypothetical protein
MQQLREVGKENGIHTTPREGMPWRLQRRHPLLTAPAALLCRMPAPRHRNASSESLRANIGANLHSLPCYVKTHTPHIVTMISAWIHHVGTQKVYGGIFYDSAHHSEDCR